MASPNWSTDVFTLRQNGPLAKPFYIALVWTHPASRCFVYHYHQLHSCSWSETFYNLAMSDTMFVSKEYKSKTRLKHGFVIVATHYWL